jgi:probable phosphoglycerate mutase
MTTFLLIRHAAPDLHSGTLAGRLPGIHLSAQGERQAQGIAQRLAALPIAAVYSSPLERAQQTAQPLAARLHLDVHCCEAIADIDYGEWSGQHFDDLAADSRWRHWNEFRSGTALPSGGMMLEVQVRAVLALEAIRRRHADQIVALISHADIIKAALAHYLATPLDLLQRIEISPGSVSVLAIYDWGARIIRVNDTGDLPAMA